MLAGGGFTLQHLRWLVVDEADRLLQPGYQGWLQQVLLAAHAPPPPQRASSSGLASEDSAPFGQSTARPWLGSMAGAARGAPNPNPNPNSYPNRNCNPDPNPESSPHPEQVQRAARRFATSVPRRRRHW